MFREDAAEAEQERELERRREQRLEALVQAATRSSFEKNSICPRDEHSPKPKREKPPNRDHECHTLHDSKSNEPVGGRC